MYLKNCKKAYICHVVDLLAPGVSAARRGMEVGAADVQLFPMTEVFFPFSGEEPPTVWMPFPAVPDGAVM